MEWRILGETALSEGSRRWSCHYQPLPPLQVPVLSVLVSQLLSWLFPALVMSPCKEFWETGHLGLKEESIRVLNSWIPREEKAGVLDP